MLAPGDAAPPARSAKGRVLGRSVEGVGLALWLVGVPAAVAAIAAWGPLGEQASRQADAATWWHLGSLVLAALALAGAGVALRLRRRLDAGEDGRALAQALFERAGDAIVVLDPDGAIVSANPAATRLLGRPLERLAGRALSRWIDGQPATLPVDGEFRLRRPDGRATPFRLTLCALPAPAGGGESRTVVTLHDLGERRAAEQRIRRMAAYDSLTGLPNRSLFRDRLGRALHRAARSGRHVALMFLDLDRFKHINDSLGHSAGDQLLQHVAATLTAALRGSDSVARLGQAGRPEPGATRDEPFTVARLGGDEFTVIVEDLHHPEEARAIAERIRDVLTLPFTIGSHELVVTTSIGITVYPDDPSPPEDLLKHADMAMYRAKEAGRNAVRFYSAEMNEHAQRRLQLEAELRRALERGEFTLEYQPKADIATMRITGVEALLRWKRNGRSVASPEEFVPVLEETGLILPVGRWVLEQAARQVVAWRRSGLPWMRVAINLSARQLRQEGLVASVAEVLADSGLPSAQLELELTETMLMDGRAVTETLRELSGLGLQLSVDDFGTGYSSLSYLKRFNLDALKIDRRFVREMPSDPEDNAIAAAVIALGRSLKLRVVAEGVETAAQRDFLAHHGCDEMQGFLVSPPLDAAEFEHWWRARLTAAQPVAADAG